jgi:FkbM family methyltransferase
MISKLSSKFVFVEDIFIYYVKKYYNFVIVDVGAHVGQYSLFAAQMGRKVISIEPFYNNILRLHKAAKLAHIDDKITVVMNAISNKRNKYSFIYGTKDNIGGFSLLNETSNGSLIEISDTELFIVETIVLDDIISCLPNGTEGVLVKIDIEGVEIDALEGGLNFFQSINVAIVFMEWGQVAKQAKDSFKKRKKVEKILEFLFSNSYDAFDDTIKILDRNNWINWPWDVIWKKKGY